MVLRMTQKEFDEMFPGRRVARGWELTENELFEIPITTKDITGFRLGVGALVEKVSNYVPSNTSSEEA